MPFAVGLMTLLLTLYLAFQSSELHTADLALREYTDLVAEHPQEKLYQAWKMFRFERVLTLSKPPTRPLDEYQKLAEATRELGDKRSAILKLIVEASELHIVPPLFESGWNHWNTGAEGGPYGTFKASSAPARGRGATVAVDNAPHSYSEAASQATSAFAAGNATDGCDAPADPAPVAVSETAAPSRAELAAYMMGIDCFLRTLNVSSADYNYPMWTAIYQTRNKVSLLVTWLLPGLYGLLGACVFLMRFMLRRDGAGGRTDAGALDVLSILLRIALGGLAGIIVGWFWVPNTPTGASPAIVISTASFGVAFLAGFSIEGLFGMLDRLNRTLMSEAPAARPAPAGTTA